MEPNSKRHAGEIGFMTVKEKVLLIYPDAKCGPDIWGIQFEIAIVSKRFIDFSSSLNVFGCGNSANKAWKAAWLHILKEMEKKMDL